jgi:uncharacterized protein YcnI
LGTSGKPYKLGKQPLEASTMVKVSIEVHNGAAHFSVSVKAQTIERAMNVVRECYPGCSVRVRFPIEPEGFFVKEPNPRAGIVGVDQPGLIAA